MGKQTPPLTLGSAFLLQRKPSWLSFFSFPSSFPDKEKKIFHFLAHGLEGVCKHLIEKCKRSRKIGGPYEKRAGIQWCRALLQIYLKKSLIASWYPRGSAPFHNYCAIKGPCHCSSLPCLAGLGKGRRTDTNSLNGTQALPDDAKRPWWLAGPASVPGGIVSSIIWKLWKSSLQPLWTYNIWANEFYEKMIRCW